MCLKDCGDSEDETETGEEDDDGDEENPASSRRRTLLLIESSFDASASNCVPEAAVVIPYGPNIESFDPNPLSVSTKGTHRGPGMGETRTFSPAMMSSHRP
jgi:hypothetical protein